MTQHNSPLDRVEAQLRNALLLIGAVREGPDEVAAILEQPNLDRDALLVLLAACVDDSRTPAELLAWYDPTYLAKQNARERERARKRMQRLRANGAKTRERTHGTHSGYNSHRDRNEEPCEPCQLAERIYQRERNQRRRDDRKSA